MPHSRQQYEQRVTRLEADARRHPSLFKLRVAVLVAIGLLAIPAAVLSMLVPLLLALFTAFAWAGGIIAAAYRPVRDRLLAALYAVRLNIRPPHGIELSRAQAPRLFALLDDLTRRLKAPRCHHVLLNEKFSAGSTVFPRFGPLGWQQHYLIIGLPLFMTLSPEHFTAVLAHEIAHLSGRHGHFSLWLGRAREAWTRFTDYLEENEGARAGMNRFFRWYTPLLAPHNFVLRRLHEIEADRQAADLAGHRFMAEALALTYIRENTQGEAFWREINKLKSTQPSPPRDLYTRLRAACRQPAPEEEEQEAIGKALDNETDFLVPHPALRDRLQLLGFTAWKFDGTWRLPADLPLPDVPAQTAADTLLGESLNAILETCNQAWWLNHLDHWVSQHCTIVKAQQRLDAGSAEDGEESAAQLYERAKAVMEVSGEDDAIPLFRQALAVNARHANSHFMLGQLLLKRKDDDGIAHLERVINLDTKLARKACRMIYDYLVQQRRPAEADACDVKDEEIIREMRQAQRERSWINTGTGFRTHSWSDQEIAVLRRQLASLPQVERAYLVRQEVVCYPEQPHYILGVFSGTPLKSLFGRKARRFHDAICERVQSRRDFSVYDLDEESAGALLARWTDVRGALVYRRDRDGIEGRQRHAVRA